MKNVTFVFIAAWYLAVSAAAEPAKMSKPDNLREKPFIDSKVIISLKTGQAVDIQKREGSWYFVKISGKTGWAPMLSIHRTRQAAAASSGSLSQTATGRSASGGVVSTTGVRGLNEEDLKTASFSEEAVAAAEKHRTFADTAAAFAGAAGLSARSVTPLCGQATAGGDK